MNYSFKDSLEMLELMKKVGFAEQAGFDFRKLHERYLNDHEFKALVDAIFAMTHSCGFTPLDLRQAAFFVACKFQMQYGHLIIEGR